MSYLAQHLTNPKRTPQSEPIPGSSQVQNHAGGYAFEVDDWTKLDRFLILGSEGGTYYVGARELTKAYTATVVRLLKRDGLAVVKRVVEVSQNALAPKNDPALLVLALASVKGDADTRATALAVLPLVARTSTHLFDFLTFRQSFGGGWGRGMRRAVGDWYLSRDADSLAYQIVKYRQRNGWTHRDVLRKAHPKPSVSLGGLLTYAAKGALAEPVALSEEGMPSASYYPHRLIQGYEMASRSPGPKVTAGLIHEYGLTREMVPTEHLNDPEVWRALLGDRDRGMPLTALVRNLATLTKVGVLKPMSYEVGVVEDRLLDPEVIRRSRMHPMQFLVALKTYAQGHGERGRATWSPVSRIVDALHEAFYLSFGNVEPTGKRVLIGLDVSGSMEGTRVNGVPGLDCRQAAAAVALVTAATEPKYGIVAFDTQSYPLTISPRQRLDDVIQLLARTGGGGTDCALPILYAERHQLPVDAFVIYTDSETWQGRIHPVQAIRRYRERTGIPAKLVTVAMASTGHSVGDAEDAGMLNVVGLDASVPAIISQFLSD